MSLELNNKIKINTYKNATFQVISILVGFYIYPLLVGYMDDIVLGVWFTLLSIASWFMILDLGISHGLRNRLTELIVRNKIKLSKAYLSSTYYYFSLFLLVILLVSSIGIYFSNLYYIFNVTEDIVPDLNLAVIIILITIITNLFFTINYSLSNALQNASFVNFRNMLFNLSMIIMLLIMIFIMEGSLLGLSILFLLSNTFINIFSTLFLYKRNLHFIPSIKLISFKLFKSNLKLGLSFFLINISAIIMFSTDTLLISHLLGPEHVIYYALTLKVFIAFTMVQGFYIGPLWSAYSAKYLEKDFDWIQKTIKKSLLITLFLYLCILITISVFNHILNIWIGNSDYYNFDLIVAIAIYVSVRLWSSNFSTLLNGLSLTHLQLKTSIAATLLNIPLSIYLVKYTSLGIAGIAYGSAISLSIFAVIAPFYTYKILKRESYK
jgi:O-antigen/teichoic acid export membrane protein